MVRLEAERLQELDRGDARSARAVDDELRRLDVAPGEMERVDEAGRRDDRRAVLVVMEDGDVHQLAQALLDDEALRRLDVLEVDAAEGRRQVAHAVDDRVRVLGADLEVEGVDVGEALEQHRLAFHHRLRGDGAAVAEAEDRGAVRDHRDEVALGGVVEGEVRVLGDRQHRHRDARRIGERQIALRRHRLRRHDLELARPPMRVELQRLLVREGRARAPRRRGVVHGSFGLFSLKFSRRLDCTAAGVSRSRAGCPRPLDSGRATRGVPGPVLGSPDEHRCRPRPWPRRARPAGGGPARPPGTPKRPTMMRARAR